MFNNGFHFFYIINQTITFNYFSFFIGLIPYLVYKNKLILLGKEKFDSVSNTLNEIQNIHNLNVEIQIYKLKNFFFKQSKIAIQDLCRCSN